MARRGCGVTRSGIAIADAKLNDRQGKFQAGLERGILEHDEGGGRSTGCRLGQG